MLAWRRLESVIAEGIANQLGSGFLVWGTKQLTRAAISWLKCALDPRPVYVSHPISRIRRISDPAKAPDTNWTDETVVNQINQLPLLFLDSDSNPPNEGTVVPVMPTAIDERRVRVAIRGGILCRTPSLDRRWPLQGVESNCGDLLYSLPSGTADPEHMDILRLKTWNGDQLVESVDSTPGLELRTDAQLKGLEEQIHAALAARDYQLVRLTKGIVVFRPFLLGDASAHGVGEEVQLWEQLATGKEDRRAVFIHFREDITRWLESPESAPQRQRMEFEILEKTTALISAATGISKRSVNRALTEASFLASAAVTPRERRNILNNKTRASQQAREEVMDTALTLGVLAKRGINPQKQVWIVRVHEMREVEMSIPDIIQFLRTGNRPPLAETLALSAMNAMTNVSLGSVRVIGHYYRAEAKVRGELQSWVDRICQPLRAKTRRQENFLIWGESSAGKTQLVKEIAAALEPTVEFVHLDLAAQTKERYCTLIEQMAESRKPTLCLLDELYAKREERWPFSEIFQKLTINETDSERRFVFVAITSQMGSRDGLVKALEARSDEGRDFIRRIRADKRFDVPAAATGDKILVFIGQAIKRAAERGMSITGVERAAIFYVLVNYTALRDIADRAKEVADRMTIGSDARVAFDHLFPKPDQKERLEFVSRYEHIKDELFGKYITVEE